MLAHCTLLLVFDNHHHSPSNIKLRSSASAFLNVCTLESISYLFKWYQFLILIPCFERIALSSSETFGSFAKEWNFTNICPISIKLFPLSRFELKAWMIPLARNWGVYVNMFLISPFIMKFNPLHPHGPVNNEVSW